MTIVDLPSFVEALDEAGQLVRIDQAVAVGKRMIIHPEFWGLLEDMGGSLKNHWDNEKQFTRHVLRGAKAEDAFPEFIARKGRLSE